MRLVSSRLRERSLTLALAGALALALASAAGAANLLGPNVDPAVTAAALGQPAGAELHVLVFGINLESAAEAAHASIRNRLGLVAADGMAVKVGDLDALAAQAGVVYIALESPAVQTGIVDGHGKGIGNGGTAKANRSTTLIGATSTATPTSTTSASPAPAPAPDPFSALATLYPLIDRAPAAWSKGLNGAGVGIAVIDSGAVQAPDFGSRLFQVVLPWQGADIADSVGHGSFVSAIAAGATPDGRFVGIAPGASVYALNVARPDGVYSSDVIAALDWVRDNRSRYNIQVINLSLSETAQSSYLADALDFAVEKLWRNGITVVVSAGNLGPGQISYAPANDPFVITVGASDSAGTLDTGDDTVASFSSFGVTRDGFVKPELLAPGRRVTSLLPAGTTLAAQAPAGNWVDGSHAFASGTSFSAPQVSGAVALLAQEHPDWTPDQVKWVLQGSGGSLAGATGTTLDAGAAVAFLGLPPAANQNLQNSSFGNPATTTLQYATASWNAASWTAASWNAASWNAASWNAASWNAASWN